MCRAFLRMPGGFRDPAIRRPFAVTEDLDRNATDLIRFITAPDEQARALARAAEGLAGAGQYQHAEDLARSITDPHEQARA
jgi:hypothetical protein